MAKKPKSNSDAENSSAKPKKTAPTESKQTAREVYMKAILTNPQFRLLKSSGESIAIIGARPPSKTAPKRTAAQPKSNCGATITVEWGYDKHSITLTPRNWSKVMRGRPLRIRAPGFSEEGFQWEYWNFASGLDGDLVVGYGEGDGVGFDGKLRDATIEETNPPSPKRPTKRRKTSG